MFLTHYEQVVFVLEDESDVVNNNASQYLEEAVNTIFGIGIDNYKVGIHTNFDRKYLSETFTGHIWLERQIKKLEQKHENFDSKVEMTRGMRNSIEHEALFPALIWQPKQSNGSILEGHFNVYVGADILVFLYCIGKEITADEFNKEINNNLIEYKSDFGLET